MSYHWEYRDVGVGVLKGLTLTSVTQKSDEIAFVAEDGRCFVMYHDQDCCESVSIDEIIGDLNDLVGSEIFVAEERDSGNLPPQGEYDESYTWTFYEIATNKGSVTIRWYGTSNGYYSESVSVRWDNPPSGN